MRWVNEEKRQHHSVFYPDLKDELTKLEDRIDHLCLMAVDLYVACREQVYQLKANETRNRVFSAFERAGLVDKDEAS